MSKDDRDEDCPLCLEPLPPFWDTNRRTVSICCGKAMCVDCMKKRNAYLDRADVEGTWGREEEQLDRTCPFCRTKLTPEESVAKVQLDKLEKGTLPLQMYKTLGLSYVEGRYGAEVNIEKGVEILMLGAERGDPLCQHAIGVIYREGMDGVSKSPGDAKRWLSAAKEQGHAIAEYCLAVDAKCEGNDAEFVQLLKGSASKGYPEACYELAGALLEGKYGLTPSIEEAIRVARLPAERGDARCMSTLGLLMCIGTAADNPRFTEGLHWAMRAAEKNDGGIKTLRGIEESVSKGCFRCRKGAPSAKALLRCSRCRAAWYCSKDCQVQHWKAGGGHKQRCIKWDKK